VLDIYSVLGKSLDLSKVILTEKLYKVVKVNKVLESNLLRYVKTVSILVLNKNPFHLNFIIFQATNFLETLKLYVLYRYIYYIDIFIIFNKNV